MMDHAYFNPLPDAAAERMAEFLYFAHRHHEAIVAEWTDRTARPWGEVDPDVQRSYRAMAVALADPRHDATAVCKESLHAGPA